ncbi:MAG: Pvc16 family protein [Solirubrobacteraceae bacterium]
MSLTISVPLNTMLADLDESLRSLLRRELARQGFDGVAVAFDAPTSEWAGALTMPTVNIFLYDLRESPDLRQREWREERGDGRSLLQRPPLRLDASYAITAWARAVEDEHRMLSQVLAVLYAYERFPPEMLAGTLGDPVAQRYPLTTRVGQAKGDDKADFWNAVGGSYRVAIDYIVTLACEPGVSYERGPEVRTATVRLGQRDGGGRSSIEEYHHAGGSVIDEGGAPVAKAWVALADLGVWGESDADGRFRFARVPAGRHRCLARGPDGAAGEAVLAVPGPGADIRLAAPARAG